MRFFAQSLSLFAILILFIGSQYLFLIRDRKIDACLNDIEHALNLGYLHKAQSLIEKISYENEDKQINSKHIYRLKYLDFKNKRYQNNIQNFYSENELSEICHHYKNACSDLGLWLIEDGLTNKAAAYLGPLAKKGDRAAEFGMLFIEIENPQKSLQILNHRPHWKYAYAVSQIKSENLDRNTKKHLLELMEESAESGFIAASEHLGRFYFYSNSWIERNYEKAQKYFQKASQAGYIKGIKHMGLWHLSQDPVDCRAFDYLRFAAQCGDAEAQYLFAQHLETLDLRNDSTIEYWYQKSAEQEYFPASERLGVLLYNQSDDLLKKHQGLKYLFKAAKSGLASAQNNYAIALIQDDPLFEAEHIKEAWNYFELAALQGNKDAMYNLEVMRQNFCLD